MKKLTIRIVQAAFLSGVLLFSSCSKKDIEAIEDQIAALEAEQAANKAALNESAEVIGNSDPIWGTAMGTRDDDDVPFSFNYNHAYLDDEWYEDTYWWNNGDSTIGLYIERYRSVDGEGYSYISIDDYSLVEPDTAYYDVYMEDVVFQEDINATLWFDHWGGKNDQWGWNETSLIVHEAKVDTLGGISTFNFTLEDLTGDVNSTDNPARTTLKWSGIISGNNGSTVSKIAKK